MSSATPDLRLCAFATLIQPLRARDSLGEKNSFYIGGKTKSHFRKVASMPTEGALRSEYAESALGPTWHGSFRAVRFPEARGNSRRPVLALLRAAGFAPGRPRGALGAAVGDAGRRAGTSLPPAATVATWRTRGGDVANRAAEAPPRIARQGGLSDAQIER